jgi:transcriptional regulator with XRE-family HTH domain
MQRGWVVSPNYRTLIEGLSALRQELGVSQRELARRIGKPPSFVNKIELLERRLDILEFVVITEALGETPHKVISGLRCNLPTTITL